jgi:hypothetical protein
MTPFVHIAMLGILFLAVYLFGKYPPRTAAIAVIVIGWMFLPSSQTAIYSIPGIPFRMKSNALALAVLLGIYLKDSGVFRTFRFHWLDIPILCWCVAPFLSSVTNGLGPYDGAGAALAQTVDWGIPYLVGRLYFGTFEGLKDLGLGLFIGALVIAPLALIEMLISPQFHIMLYGYYPHDFSQTKRGFGYRPSVFMKHGLELAIYNASAVVVGWQLFLRKTIRGVVPLLKIPLAPAVIGLSVVLLISRSSGALMLCVLALVAFQVAVMLKTKIPLLLLLLLPLAYMNLRATGAWDGQNLIEASKKLTGNEERVGSLSFRLFNENLLVEKARLRLAFGWAGFQRSFVTDERGRFISVPDGMWILTLGKNGLFGLTALSASILLAPFLFFWKCPSRRLGDPFVAPAAALATCLCIFMADSLFNAFFNPVLLVAAGGLSSLLLSPSAFFATSAEQGLAVAEADPMPVTRVI